MKSARTKEVKASLKFLNIRSTLDVAQILKEMGWYSRFPESPVLCWGELGTFFMISERIGDR